MAMAPDDFLHNSEIDEILSAHLPRGRWVELSEIYEVVEAHAELTEADLWPAAGGTEDLRWKRNVRNLLQARKASGRIGWDGAGRYRLAVRGSAEPAEPAFETGRVYRRQELHDRYGGQRYGGISTPANHPIVILISGEEGAAYGYDDERLDDGTLVYFGEGQVGPMAFTRGNAAIRDHIETGEELHVFRKVKDGFIRYEGQYVYTGHEIRSGIRDRGGNKRDAIAFRLVPHEQFVQDEGMDGGAVEDIPEHDLAALRAAALEPLPEGTQPTETRRTVWRRSRAVRLYVLQRAQGTCEGCGADAPFLRPNGRPYLEPHHARRLSDGGPDDPRFVIALCPTCHARVHYGADGREYNSTLATKLGELENLPAV